MTIIFWYLVLGVIVVHFVVPVSEKYFNDHESLEDCITRVGKGSIIKKIFTHLLMYIIWLPAVFIAIWVVCRSRTREEAHDLINKLFED